MTAVWESMVAPSKFGRKDKTGVAAAGHHVLMADGRRYLCATSGLWNVNLGYGNRAVASAIAKSLEEASYLTLFRYSNEYAERAARALIEVARPAEYRKVIFSTSGAAANDLVLKLGRQFCAITRGRRETLVVSMRNSYHGLTYGGMAISGDSLEQSLYGVDQRAVRSVSPTDPAEILALIASDGPSIAQIVIEPVMGAGAVEVSGAVIAAAFEARRRYGAVVVADEVASGFGRTGRMFHSETWPEAPDILIASKGLTNGTCAGAAVLVGQRIFDAFEASDSVFLHGETQAGTPSTCAAILATIDEFHRLGALRLAGGLSSRLDELLDELSRLPSVVGHRGVGCFRGIEVRDAQGRALDSAAVHRLVDAVRSAGALVHPSVSGILLMPPLTYSSEDMDSLRESLLSGFASWS